MRGAPISEKFKFADLVDNRAFRYFSQQGAHVTGNDQRTGRGIKLFGALQDVHRASRLGKQRGSEKTRSRAADNGNLTANLFPASFFNHLIQSNLPRSI